MLGDIKKLQGAIEKLDSLAEGIYYQLVVANYISVYRDNSIGMEDLKKNLEKIIIKEGLLKKSK